MNRYEDQIILTTPYTNRPYYKGNFYPNIPLSESDIYIVTNVGDRLDSLAYSYYNDSTLWWVISMANNNITRGALFPVPGTQLRIPTNLDNILELFYQFNQRR